MNSFPATYIGKKHIHFDSIDSTNTYALNLTANNNPIEGTAISAGFQHNGRGQIGRKWDGNADENVYLSIILKPYFMMARDQFLLNQCIAIALKEALEEHLDKEIKLKWPNDLYVKNSKIGGILIQNQLKGNDIFTSIVGIGINVNQSDFSADLPNPTSLYLESGKITSLSPIYQSIFNCLEYRYEQLRENKYSEITNEYLNALYGRNDQRIFKVGSQTFMGEIIEVDDIGRLIVQSKYGLKAYNHNEISLVIEALEL